MITVGDLAVTLINLLSASYDTFSLRFFLGSTRHKAESSIMPSTLIKDLLQLGDTPQVLFAGLAVHDAAYLTLSGSLSLTV